MRIRSLVVLLLLASALTIAAAVLVGMLGSPPASSRRSSVRIGLTSGGVGAAASALAAQKLGARLVRVEWPIGTPAADMRGTISDYADRGIEVLALAGFKRRLPSPGEARNLAGWAREFGPGGTFWADRADGRLAIHSIEFGNETSFADQGTQERGREYAERFRDAREAIHGPGGNPAVGLLAQADDAGIGPGWVNAMFDAVPDLGDLVDGWTVHPYGPPDRARAKLDRLIAQTAARGAPATIPIDITEWGVTTADGRCLSDNYGWANRCMTYREAADALRTTIGDLEQRYRARLRTFILYQATDQYGPPDSSDREHFFGALTLRLRKKGDYTDEVRTQLARSAPEGRWRGPPG